MQTQRTKIGAAGGFTLLELMIVVGIIVLLMAIMIPALSAAKMMAQKKNTQQQLAALASGIEAYATQFNKQYPGPLGPAEMGYSGSGPPAYDFRPYTSALNLRLGLGGAVQNSGVSPVGFVLMQPLTARYASIKQTGVVGIYAAFYTAGPKEIAPVRGGATQPDGPCMVYYDRFNSPLPLLYFRRAPAVNPVAPPGADATSSVQTSTVYVGYQYFVQSVEAAYYREHNKLFYDTNNLQSLDGLQWSQATSGFNASNNYSAAVPAGFNSWFEYALTDPSYEGGSQGRRARGGYVLMSAGADRVYGPVIKNGNLAAAADDIVLFGGTN